MNAKKTINCVVLGTGGHAAVLIDTIQAGDIAHLHGILDPDSSRWGQDLLGVPVLGGDDLLPELATQGVTHFVVAVGSTGNNRPRERLYQLGCSYDLNPLTVIHRGAFCSKRASVGAGAQLFAGCIVNARTRLGCNVIINSGAIVEHDCKIGDHVHVATGAVLASTVHVGKFAHIGVGATVRQLISIGEGAVVAAGAVVVNDVTNDVVVGGVPARLLKRKNEK